MSAIVSPPNAVRAHALLLAWYRDMGIDCVVAEDSVNWLERGDTRPGAEFQVPTLAVQAPPNAVLARPGAGDAAASQLQSPTAPRPDARPPPRAALQVVPQAAAPSSARQFPTAAPDDATLAARAAAADAGTLDDLKARLDAFDGCALKATAKSLCFYRGAATARVMVIGEAPGAEEDKVGKPFVGPAGQMLDQMLKAIGLDEATCHITNFVYWRPPGNRTPTPQEAIVCRPFLERQVELVKPEILLLLGGPASNHILDKPEGIMKLRGRWRDIEIGRHRMRAMVTLHPMSLLRTPISKRMAWRDMLAIAEALDGRTRA